MKKPNEPMSESMFYILLALLNPLHGYAIVHVVEELSHGRVALSSGTLYGILTRMEIENYIKLIKIDGRKKNFVITKEGKLAVKEECVRLMQMTADASSYILQNLCDTEGKDTDGKGGSL